MKPLHQSLLSALILPFLASFVLATPNFQEDPGEENGDEPSEVVEEEQEEDDETNILVLTGGEIHTGTGAVLKGATLIARKGKITEIGYDLVAPEDAEVMDISGYRVYPGLVAISSIGLFGGGSPIRDTVDPFSRTMTLAVAGGVTATVNGNEVAKLKRGHIKGLVMGNRPMQNLSYSKSSASGKRSLREKLDRASEYLRQYRKWENDVRSNKELKEPKKTGVDNGVLDVLKGVSRAHFSSNDRTDLFEIARLAQKYGFRPVITGCREGWTVADELGRAGAAAILTPRDRRQKDESLVQDGGSSIENAAILYRAGVEIAIIPGTRGISLDGIAGRDIMHLPIEAAYAIRGGLPEEAALAAITTVPARLLGVGHRIGTLEIGMDADLIVTDGDVLHYATFVQWALIGGKVIYDKEDEMYFAHIRPRPESELAPKDPVDAGETEADIVDPPEEEGSGEPDESDEGSGDGDGL